MTWLILGILTAFFEAVKDVLANKTSKKVTNMSSLGLSHFFQSSF
jgi:hypothetical protein